MFDNQLSHKPVDIKSGTPTCFCLACQASCLLASKASYQERTHHLKFNLAPCWYFHVDED